MFILELMFALFFALILTLIFASGIRRQGWGVGLLIFFMILFLATWAGGVWITPFGPLWWGVSWLPYLFVGLLIALLLAALLPADRIRPRAGGGVRPEDRSQTETLATLDAFLWILMFGLLIAIIIAYLR